MSSKTWLFCLVAACGLLVTSSVLAGDAAQIEMIGFNQAGTHFAFEQWGVFAASGGAYSELFIVETATSELVVPPIKNSSFPVHSSTIELDPFDFESMANLDTQLETTWDLESGIAMVRRQTLAAARPLLRKYGLDRPVAALAMLEHYERVGQTTSCARKHFEESYGATEIRLQLYEMEAPGGRCRYFPTPKAVLDAAIVDVNGPVRRLLSHPSLPHEVDGALEFEISGVYLYEGGNVPEAFTSFVAMIGYHIPGPNGPDKRYIPLSFVR